jgi:hypothetical protein
MNTASLELCKELYELSGWNAPVVSMDGPTPRYDLGYLLRKLPKHVEDQWLHIAPITDNKWAAHYMMMGVKSAGQDEWADTPEDAACKLAIELFKQGILVKEAV